MPTLEQIRAKMQKLQQQADALIARQAQKVVDQIRGLMIEHGLTTADIEAHARRRRQRALRGAAAVKTASGETKAKLPPKYRNPKTGETWSGRARPPAWIANARDRSKFLIIGKAVASAKSASGKSAAGKSASAGKALYRDPETGKTWTGHGRAPAWIADAADRSAYLIAKGGAAKKVAAKKVAAKTMAAKKVAAKKAVARKAATAASKAARSASDGASVAAKKHAVKRARKASSASKKAIVASPVIDAAATTESAQLSAP